MNTAVYETVERVMRVLAPMDTDQYDRSCALARYRPPGFFRDGDTMITFRIDDDPYLLALQDYLVEQRLPHRITATREWRP